MNCYEKSGLLRESIQDMEARLGQYLWLDGCEKTDVYAQTLISAIKATQADLAELCKWPVGCGGDDG